MEIRNNTKLDGRRDAASDVTPSSRPGDAASAGAGRSDSPAAAGDRVTLTDAAQRLLKAEESEAPVDRAKVEEIRRSIADGTYRPDSARIAEKLIELDNPSES
ncbi:MAG: flagellar biosynthesis anti-sigma factor FlgM [Gammaproteobacteria bacterium]|nr:flagellar biosynthesis anti-sigma factor FlgM [Gammaproteobacteria bacterium]